LAILAGREVRRLAIGFALVAAVASTGVASAHAVLLRATPASNESLAQAPARVELLFSEALDPDFTSLQVQNTDGLRVDLGDGHVDPDNDHLLVASLQAALSTGTYTVVWRNVSAVDVHPDQGEYQLFVGVPVTAGVVATVQNTSTPEATSGRWWFYVAASLFGGVLASWKLVIGPVLNEDGPRDLVRRRAYRLIVAGGALLIVGTLYSALAQAAAAANVPVWEAFGRPVSDLLLRGRFASIWWPRLGLEVASLLLVAFGGIEGLASECALATLPAVLLTSALTSHGAALPSGAAPGIALDWLHIVGATAWVGGLIALLASAPELRRAHLLRNVVVRFGRFALVASALVLVSGVLQGALEVGAWDALLTSPYGQLVVLKAGLLAGMLVLAVFNQVRGPGRGVPIELALGVIVFGVAAMLSGTPPTPNA
jgi:copper transport protein